MAADRRSLNALVAALLLLVAAPGPAQGADGFRVFDDQNISVVEIGFFYLPTRTYYKWVTVTNQGPDLPRQHRYLGPRGAGPHSPVPPASR